MSLDAAVEVLAGADPDRLGALLTLRPEDRPRLIALYALAAELARAPRASGEAMLAEIRLQWWIEALQRLPQSAGQHPVLAAVAETWGADAPALAALGEAQRAACYPEEFSNPDKLLSWIDATSGELSWQAARALGAGPEAEAATRAQGRAIGIAEVLASQAHDQPEALREAGLAAASAAAAGRAAVPRAAAAALYAGPARARALISGSPAPVSEFVRRAALLRFVFGRDWRMLRAS